MKIVIIIYVVSWFILLAFYIATSFGKKKTLFSEKEPWHLYAIIIAFAPLIVLYIPYLLISSYMEKKRKKVVKEQEQREAEENANKQRASQKIQAAINEQQEEFTYDHSMVAQTLVKKIEKKDYDSFMQYLVHLSLPDGASLHVEKCKEEDTGDTSKLYVETAEGEYNQNIWDFIKAENSIDGAWEAYFLYKVWHILPLWWHANYSRRIYMFSEEDADSIQLLSFSERERRQPMIQKKVKSLISKPEVVEVDGKYHVSCCYWTNFGGLIKETVEVFISPEGKVELKDIERQTLYEYTCGIMY